MDFFTNNKQLSLITVVALLIAIIATVTVPKLSVPLVAKQITLNPLVRFLLYFGIAFLLLKVMAFAMVFALLAIVITYIIEWFWPTNEGFSDNSVNNIVSNVKNDQVQDQESQYIDDISEMSIGRPKRSVDGNAVMGVTFEDDKGGKEMSLYSDASDKDGGDGVVGYDGGNKYASV